MAEDQPQRQIPMDGSYGAGPMAEVTIYTKTADGGRKEETFTLPYFLINFGHLIALDSLHLILGYGVIKTEKPDQMKDLGLA